MDQGFRPVSKEFGVMKFRGLLVVASLSMLIEYLMGFSANVIAGNLLGETALAGLNLMQSPMNLVTFISCLIGTGTVICFSLETGRFDRRRAEDMFSQGVWSSLLFGTAMVLALIFGRDAFLGMFNAGADVVSYAVPYWNWFVPCALLEPLAFLLVNAICADGGAKLCFWSYVVQFIFNTGVSFLLCRWMGIAGCALGTTLGNLAAILMLCTHFFRKWNTLRIRLHFSGRDFMRICKSSFADASVRLSWAALFLLLNSFVIGRFGSETLPVLTVVLTVIGFSEAFNGVANAAQPIVGVYIGERNDKGVRMVMRAAELTVLWEGIVVSAVLMLWPQSIVRLVGIDTPELMVASCRAIRLVSIGIVFSACVSLFDSYYLFIERTTLACTLTVSANFAVPIVLYPVLGSLLGADGVWLALGLAPLVTVLVFGGYLLVRYGRSMFPLLLVKGRDANIHIFSLELDDRRIAATSASVAEVLERRKVSAQVVLRASLMVEEVFMAVKDRNGDKVVHGEVTLDLNDSEITLILRDDGEVFDITDADAKITSLRMFLVTSFMEAQPGRRNLTTTGYNRNVFKFRN